MLSAQDTLSPPAFAVKNYNEVDYIFIRSLFILFCIYPLIYLIWFNMESILIFLGQPAESSLYAGIFLRIHTLSFPAICIFESGRKYLSAQNIVKPFIYISILSLVLHFIYIQIYLNIFNFEFASAPLAQVSTNWSYAILTMIYINKYHPSVLNKILNTNNIVIEICKNFDKLKLYLKLGIPGVLSMSEWWYWEFILFLSGTLGEVELGNIMK